MSSHLSYIIETNGENGVEAVWHLLSYVPNSIVWEENVNSFSSVDLFPNPESVDSPDYVRAGNGTYEYYRKAIEMPSKAASFILSVLIDGSEENGGFYYDSFSSFLTITKDVSVLNVCSKDNLGATVREGIIKITSNQYNETEEVYIVQNYTPVHLILESFVYEGLDGIIANTINSNLFEHAFYWLTNETSPNSERLTIEVLATGPRNGFIVKDVEKYVYEGELNNLYTYSSTNQKYYKTLQKCSDGGLETVYEEVIYDESTSSVLKKIKYENDLNIVKNGNTITITNYGRCFLQNDAYYVITLANVDKMNITNKITIKYRDESL